MRFEELKKTLLEMGFNEDEIKETASLSNDLGMDSTERVELFSILSKSKKISLSTQRIEELCELSIEEMLCSLENQNYEKKNSIISSEVEKMTNKGGELQVCISPKTLGATQLIMGKVELKPGEELIRHVHEYGEEAVYVMEGKGVAYLNEEEVKLCPDLFMLVPQNVTHKIINIGEVVLIIIFATAPLAPKASVGDRLIK